MWLSFIKMASHCVEPSERDLASIHITLLRLVHVILHCFNLLIFTMASHSIMWVYHKFLSSLLLVFSPPFLFLLLVLVLKFLLLLFCSYKHIEVNIRGSPLMLEFPGVMLLNLSLFNDQFNFPFYLFFIFNTSKVENTLSQKTAKIIKMNF